MPAPREPVCDLKNALQVWLKRFTYGTLTTSIIHIYGCVIAVGIKKGLFRILVSYDEDVTGTN